MYIFKGIEMFPGSEKESNIYLIDGEFLVDAGTGMYFADIKHEIESKFDTTKITTLVNTHNHFDHTGGDRKFRDWLKAQIAIHSADRDDLEAGRTLSEFFDEKPRVTTVDKVLKNGSIIRTENFEFEVIHTPGHSPGSICLYDKNKRILVSGDTLFSEGVGRTDLPGGSNEHMVRSLEKLLEYDIQYLLPGHGVPKLGGVEFVIKRVLAKLNKDKIY
jgi:glyoxylase-like metal-dependent hydrolase (beta-lactamase superfamily II)